MKATKEEILQSILDNLSVQVKGMDATLIDALIRAYMTLSGGCFNYKPAGLDSGQAMHE